MTSLFNFITLLLATSTIVHASTFDFLKCVNRGNPSDNATDACQTVLKDNKSLEPVYLNELARHICLRTVPCALQINIADFAGCKHVESGEMNPVLDFQCRKSFAFNYGRGDDYDRISKFNNCEQTVGESCSIFSHLRTEYKVREQTEGIKKLHDSLYDVNATLTGSLSNMTSTVANLTSQIDTALKMPACPKLIMAYAIYSIFGCMVAGHGLAGVMWCLLYIFMMVFDDSWLSHVVMWVLPVAFCYVKHMLHVRAQRAPAWVKKMAKFAYRSTGTSSTGMTEEAFVRSFDQTWQTDDNLDLLCEAVDAAVERLIARGEGVVADLAHNIDVVARRSGVDLGERAPSAVINYRLRSSARLARGAPGGM
jgi:hypothetical protein